MTAAREAATAALASAETIEERGYRASKMSWVAKALAAAGDTTTAREAADAIDKPKERGFALSYVAQALATAGDATAAWEAVDAIGDCERKALALSWVSLALAASGDMTAARQAATAARRLLTPLSSPDIGPSRWFRSLGRWPHWEMHGACGGREGGTRPGSPARLEGRGVRHSPPWEPRQRRDSPLKPSPTTPTG